MNQDIPTEWPTTERIIFRLSFCYLFAYFVFLDGFILNYVPVLNVIHAPVQDISNGFVGFINRLFVHKKYDGEIYKGFGDTSWSCLAIMSYFILSVIATIAWSILDSRKTYHRLFTVLHTYARYYLAFVLFLYGFGKLFGVQFFDPSPDYLMQPLANIDPHTLLWTVMGSSKSYNFFGGLMEVLPAVLLLFRRTTALGGLIAIATLVNVLMLDIAYDTLVKITAAHFILVGFFILSPYIKRLVNFFLLDKAESLAIPRNIRSQKFKWITGGLKVMIIAYGVVASMKMAIKISDDYSKPYFGGIDGIYEVKDFYLNRQLIQPLLSDTLRWKKLGINKFGQITLQQMNDSVSYYTLSVDSMTKRLTLSLWNDSSFESHLNYSVKGMEEYLFEGTYKNDSIHFNARKMNLQQAPLLKDKGKVKWLWW